MNDGRTRYGTSVGHDLAEAFPDAVEFHHGGDDRFALKRAHIGGHVPATVFRRARAEGFHVAYLLAREIGFKRDR